MLLRLWRTELKLVLTPLLSRLRLTAALTEPAFLVLQGRGEYTLTGPEPARARGGLVGLKSVALCFRWS